MPLARALVAGGLPVIEVTLRTRQRSTRCARSSPKCRMRSPASARSPSPPTSRPACDAGAAFLVSPGTPARCPRRWPTRRSRPSRLRDGNRSHGARRLRLPVLKFFPAEPSGGARWLRAVAAPLPELGSARPAASMPRTPRPISRCATWSRSAGRGSRRPTRSRPVTLAVSLRWRGRHRNCVAHDPKKWEPVSRQHEALARVVILA